MSWSQQMNNSTGTPDRFGGRSKRATKTENDTVIVKPKRKFWDDSYLEKCKVKKVKEEKERERVDSIQQIADWSAHVNTGLGPIWQTVFGHFEWREARTIKLVCKTFKKLADQIFNPAKTPFGTELLFRVHRKPVATCWLLEDGRVWKDLVRAGDARRFIEKLCDNGQHIQLDFIARNKMVKFTEDKYGDLMSRICDQKTLIDGEVACFKILLETQLNPVNLQHDCLEISCIHGHSEIVKLLLESPKVDLSFVARKKPLFYRALMLAVSHASWPCISLLLKDNRVNLFEKADDQTKTLGELVLQAATGSSIFIDLLRHPSFAHIENFPSATNLPKLIMQEAYPRKDNRVYEGELSSICALFEHGVYDKSQYEYYLDFAICKDCTWLLNWFARSEDKEIDDDIRVKLLNHIFHKKHSWLPLDDRITKAALNNPVLDHNTVLVPVMEMCLERDLFDGFMAVFNSLRTISRESVNAIFESCIENGRVYGTSDVLSPFLMRFKNQIDPDVVHRCLVDSVKRGCETRVSSITRYFDVDMSANDNEILAYALSGPTCFMSCYNQLIKDKRVDLSLYDHKFLYMLCRVAETKSGLRVALSEGRVDPSANESIALDWCVINSSLNVLKVLLRDKRADPTARNYSALRLAYHMGNEQLFKTLMVDDRINPKKYMFYPDWYHHTFGTRLE